MQILAKNFYHQLGVRVQRAGDWPKIQRVIQDRAAADLAHVDPVAGRCRTEHRPQRSCVASTLRVFTS